MEAGEPWRYVSGIGKFQERWMWKGEGGTEKQS